MADAKIIELRPANARRAGVRNLPVFRVPELTRRFLDRLSNSTEYVAGYRWIGGGIGWRLDDSWFGIEYFAPRGEPGYWQITGGGLDGDDIHVADPAEAIAYLREHCNLPDPWPSGGAS